MGGLRQAGARVLPAAFLLLVFLTGGATLEGDVAKAVTGAVSGGLLAGLCLFSKGWMKPGVLVPLAFAAGFVALGLAQLVPLPPELITALPGRQTAYLGLEALGQSPERLALSLAPEATAISLLAVLAPLCGFALVAGLRWSRSAQALSWMIPALGVASAGLGFAQVVFTGVPELYFYDFTNTGSPTGFFSNANHQASFLLMCLPFVGVLAADLRRDWEGGDADVARAVGVGVLGFILLFGILAAGSAAGYLMLAPVALLSVSVALTRRQSKSRRRAPVILIGAVLLAVAAASVFSSPRLSGLGQTSFDDGPTTRAGMNRVGAGILAEHWQAGTGLGSYSDVYSLYEDPETVSLIYIAHAHNDYLEWLVETGLAGAALLAAFLLWWLARAAGLWARAGDDALSLRRAASAACLVPLLHSLVDYPLRTPALLTLAAMCLALMVVPQRRAGDGAPPRAAEDGEGPRGIEL